jgi:hypothetical protein
MVPFLGGVRDLAGHCAFVPVAGPRIVAVDLLAGAVLWRRERIGRPVAATESRMVTLDCDGSAFRLRFFGARDGHELAALGAPGLPAWAADTAAGGQGGIDVTASPEDDGIHLAWRVRRQYRGGAPPRPDIAAGARQDAAGAWHVTIDPPGVQDVSAGQSADARSDGSEEAAALPEPSADPTVVALARAGGCVFALKAEQRGGATVIALEGQGEGGAVLWTVVLAESGGGPPRALRR